MIIDFDNIQKKRISGFRGGVNDVFQKLFADEKCKIMQMTIPAGSSVGLHTHEDNSEIVYFLKGNVDIIYDDTEEKGAPGMCHYCPMGHSHSIINNGDEDAVAVAIIPEHR